MVENRWVGRESGDRQLINVVLQRAAIEQIAGYVVQPQTLTKSAERFRCL